MSVSYDTQPRVEAFDMTTLMTSIDPTRDQFGAAFQSFVHEKHRLVGIFL